MRKKVFLGGTCADSKWRNQMIIHLAFEGLEWFDPVVDDWNEEAQANEIRERASCGFCLYTITPKMIGVYGVAEAVDDSNKRSAKTVFVLLRDDDHEHFLDQEWRSLSAVKGMIKRNGGAVFDNLKSAAVYMGREKSEEVELETIKASVRKAVNKVRPDHEKEA